jgi:type VI protein secretion system component Hcp
MPSIQQVLNKDNEPRMLGEEPMHKLRDDELDFVTGGRRVVHHDLVITKVVDRASPQLFDQD